MVVVRDRICVVVVVVLLLRRQIHVLLLHFVFHVVVVDTVPEDSCEVAQFDDHFEQFVHLIPCYQLKADQHVLSCEKLKDCHHCMLYYYYHSDLSYTAPLLLLNMGFELMLPLQLQLIVSLNEKIVLGQQLMWKNHWNPMICTGQGNHQQLTTHNTQKELQSIWKICHCSINLAYHDHDANGESLDHLYDEIDNHQALHVERDHVLGGVMVTSVVATHFHGDDYLYGASYCLMLDVQLIGDEFDEKADHCNFGGHAERSGVRLDNSSHYSHDHDGRPRAENCVHCAVQIRQQQRQGQRDVFPRQQMGRHLSKLPTIDMIDTGADMHYAMNGCDVMCYE